VREKNGLWKGREREREKKSKCGVHTERVCLGFGVLQRESE